MYLWCLFVLPFHDITERQLHNNNARGVNIQLHAHQLHNTNHWEIHCAIIPAPPWYSRPEGGAKQHLSSACCSEGTPHVRDGNHEANRSAIWVLLPSGHVRPRQGTEIFNFCLLSPLDFLKFLQWICFISLQDLCAI